MSQRLPDGGALVALAKHVMARAGIRLTVEFFPWTRTLANAQRGEGFDGYLAEYDSPDIRNHWYVSAPMAASPLGFAERNDAPVNWSTVADLVKQDVKVGVVEGYINTESLDGLIRTGALRAERSPDDETSLLKLTATRVNLCVMDPHVFAYLMQTSPRLTVHKGALRMNSQLLESKRLYVVFRQTARGKLLRDLFNQALASVDREHFLSAYFEQQGIALSPLAVPADLPLH